MADKTFTITTEAGIHARPATLLVNTVSSFESDIQLEYNGRSVNLKSIMGIMSLGVPTGAIIKVTATGSDEDAVIEAVEDVLKREGLGE